MFTSYGAARQARLFVTGRLFASEWPLTTVPFILSTGGLLDPGVSM
jgi:hypothetical protein